ncbi:MAG: AsmA-like C-terminal region-containing protein, partial [Planctomycetota bacterium]
RLDPIGVFGGRPVRSIHIDALVAEIGEGSSLDIFSRGRTEAGPASPETAASSQGGGSFPELAFSGPRILVRSAPEDVVQVFFGERLRLERADARRFRLEAGGGRLGGIPFERGRAKLIPQGRGLLVGDLKADAFGGLMEGYLELRGGGEDHVNGELMWHSIDLGPVARHYGWPDAESMTGRVDARVVFAGRRFSLDKLRGKGWAQLADGNFVSPISLNVVLFLKLPADRPSIFHHGEMEFSFENSKLYLERAHAFGTSFDLEAQGEFTYTGKVDLEVTHGNTTVHVSGAMADPDVTVLPFNYVTRPFNRVFRDDVDDEE